MMSDEGEKTCPLCAEEMDLTDQQLKPCKCGYEICVWCWHHIIDMAEKDNVEGRCPACRTPYNKEKIVDKGAQCERLVSEMSVEKKVKSKSKGKTPDGRKHLSSVRVIQRNLVYIVGLPLNLADEDLLQQKEYFAQYGKVQKVSISRTTGGTIQQFPNNTCGVYITYLNEEEAVRCIQSVHGYTLEGKPLRACFGTTKYCHAWLRNAPCGNPDCLYLHEIGAQEDSFTKDEIISAYTRSRVQQITGAPIDMERRSGNILPPPPPSDEFCNNDGSSSGTTNKSSTKNPDMCSEDILGSSVWQTPASSVRGSAVNSSSIVPIVPIPTATWGKRAATNSGQLSATSITSAIGHSKQKPDSCSASVSFSTAVANPSLAKVSVVHSDSVKKLNGKSRPAIHRNKSEPGPLASDEVYLDGDNHRNSFDISGMVDHSLKPAITSQASTVPLKVDESMNMRVDLVKSSNFNELSSGINPDKPQHVPSENEAQGLCSDTLSRSIDTQGIQHRDGEEYKDLLISPQPLKAASSNKDLVPPRYKSELRLEPEIQIAQSTNHKVEDDFDTQRLGDKKVFSGTDYLSNLSDSSRVLNPREAYGLHNVDSFLIDKKFDNLSVSQSYSIPALSNGYTENRGLNFTDLNGFSNHSSYMAPNELKVNNGGRYGNGGDFVTKCGISNNDIGESSIISNILSMDFESWDESLVSPHDMAKILGENDGQESLGVSSLWKAQNNNRSRFSFARQEDQVPNFEQSFTSFGQSNYSFRNSFKDNDDGGISNGFSGFSTQHPGNLVGIQNRTSNNFSVSRQPTVSAPPGFSGPSKAPPPGFTSYDRIEQTFDKNSGNHLLNRSSLLRNTNQSTSTVHIDTTNVDIEFIDPAILAVGKGRFPSSTPNGPSLDMRSAYQSHISNFENEARLQLLMEKPLLPHQNPRYVETGDNFSSRFDNYGIPPRFVEQTHINNSSHSSQFGFPQSRNQLMSSGNWDGWNEFQGENDSSMAEFHRTERLGVNKYKGYGYDDSKYRIPSSGDLYNQTYGI